MMMEYDFSDFTITDEGTMLRCYCGYAGDLVEGDLLTHDGDDVRLTTAIRFAKKHIEEAHETSYYPTLDDIDQASRRANREYWKAKGPIHMSGAGGGGGGGTGFMQSRDRTVDGALFIGPGGVYDEQGRPAGHDGGLLRDPDGEIVGSWKTTAWSDTVVEPEPAPHKPRWWRRSPR